MGTIRGGGLECDRCGADCKALYGFAMTVHRAAQTYNNRVKDVVEKIDKKYGKHDFIICWDCTIQMMGISSLHQSGKLQESKNDAQEKQTKVPEKVEQKA